MALSATQRLDDAFDATKALLLPFDASTWVRLAVMVFFIGGLGGGLSGGSNVGGGGGTGGVDAGGVPSPDRLLDGFQPLFGPGIGLLVVALVVVGLLVGLLFLYVGSVMEFVFVEALVTREAVVRERFSARRWQGTRLFGFRIVLFLLVAALVGAAAALGLALQGPGIRVLAVLFAIPVLLVVGLVAAVINGFTTVFVVPIMLEERCGVLAGWRQLRPAIRAQLDEFGVYLLLSVILGAIGGMFVATVVGIVGVVLFLPVGLLGFAALVAGGGPALVLLVPVVFVVLLALGAIGAVVSVPVVTYLRYYALLVLGDTTDYDLLGVAESSDAGTGDETPA
ncbi:DUF7544 domain-containing protein [Halorarius litoreus]|uniref:DUF7544 domain-containing protein n=1 Tax=Halorarius litoreus TaxID=2962676 RepID=UPI0020CB7882|nr:hypothetical protein [Halorarius litoreus]